MKQHCIHEKSLFHVTDGFEKWEHKASRMYHACFVFEQAAYCTWIQEFSLLPIQALTDPDKCNRANPASHLSVRQGKDSENILESFALNM